MNTAILVTQFITIPFTQSKVVMSDTVINTVGRFPVVLRQIVFSHFLRISVIINSLHELSAFVCHLLYFTTIINLNFLKIYSCKLKLFRLRVRLRCFATV